MLRFFMNPKLNSMESQKTPIDLPKKTPNNLPKITFQEALLKPLQPTFNELSNFCPLFAILGH